MNKNKLLDSKWSIDKLFNIDPNQLISIHEGSTIFPPRIFVKSKFLCEGETLLLETGYYDNIIWSNGSTSRKIEISEPGEYFVIVEDSNGIEYISDTVNILIEQPPEFQIKTKDIMIK